MPSRILLLLIFSLGVCLSKAQLPQDFVDNSFNGPWQLPAQIVFDEQGQGYVIDLVGKVFVVDTNQVVLPTPLIDLSEEVAKWLDHGLASIALHPNFLDNGYFYLLYTVDLHHYNYFGTPDYNPGTTETHQATFGRITRYTADKDQHYQTIVPNTRKVILGATIEDGFPITSDSHGLGSLVFGTDGTLLATCGEGASSTTIDNGSDPITYFQQALDRGVLTPKENIGTFRSQLIDCLSGKMIRIDPDTGEGLASNPFFDATAPTAPKSRVWALGLRNPFRFIVVPESGSHYPADGQPGQFIVGDVGEETWEEINIVQSAGQNFGWPMYEGLEKHPVYGTLYTANPDAVNPLYDGIECEITNFTFQDLLAPDTRSEANWEHPCDGEANLPEGIIGFQHTRPALAYHNQDVELGTPPFSVVPGYTDQGQPISIPIEADNSSLNGAHFLGSCSLAGGFYTGETFPDNYHNRYFHLDYSGWIKVFDYDFEEGLMAVDSFHTDCEKIVSMAIDPKTGCLYYTSLETRRLHQVCFGGNNKPIIDLKYDQQYGPSPLSVQFDASESYDVESSITWSWDFGDGNTSNSPNPNHTFTAPNNQPIAFTVSLTITDEDGASSIESLPVALNNTPPTVKITSFQEDETYWLNETTVVRLEADVQDQETATADLSYNWEAFLHHNDHFHPIGNNELEQAYTVLSPIGCESDTYWYRINLTVEDPHGLKGTDEVLLFPACEPTAYQLDTLGALSKQEGIELSWSFTDQQGLAAFEIEKTTDFLKVSLLGTVDANEADTYDFFDATPVIGNNLYRLRIKAENGDFSYTSWVLATYPPIPDYQLFPNPVKAEAQLKINKVQSEQLVLDLYRPTGKLVRRFQWSSQKNSSFATTFNIGDLPDGVYFYFIREGNSTKGGKLMLVK